MSKFNAFRRKLDINNKCVANYESAFITEGTSAVQIYSLRLKNYKPAAIIITDKEGPDTSLVYTFKEQAREDELVKGDYYTWNNNTYFVYEDVQVVLDTNYKKQKSYQCNVEFNYTCECGSNTYFGYYVSSLARYVDTTLQSNLNISDNDKPVLILPALHWVKVGAQFVIHNKPYKIIEIDTITNKGIAYCSLDRDFVSKQKDVVIEEINPVLVAGIEQLITTYDDYLQTSHKVDIISRTNAGITIVVPYGLDEIVLTTKDDSGRVSEQKYKVVA